MRTLANVALFQLGWLASVVSAARGFPWLGVAVVVVVVSFHLSVLGNAREVRLVMASAALGALVDSMLASSGLVSYASPTLTSGLAPTWIVGMWANFAITIEHSIAFLRDRPWLAALCGGVSGPVAYWGASRLGAVELPYGLASLTVLGIVWALSVPVLGKLATRIR